MVSKLKVSSRSYGGKKFRPTPVCFSDEDLGLFVCVTPWGNQDIAELVIDSVKGYFSIANEDTEVTVPYERKPSLDRFGNILRMAVIVASEKVNKKYNGSSHSAGFEIFASLLINKQWTYVSCGQPSMVLLRPEMGALPLHTSLDLNTKLTSDILVDPLPSDLLGLNQRPPINYGVQKLQKHDRLALISRSYIPNDFFAMDPQHRSLETMSDLLAQDNPAMPFWLGLINFS